VERVQDGRVFLAGDAAHVMPPYGGFGGNCGIHDAHNLAWKLAMVVKGQAAGSLLSTYEPERMPAEKFTTEQAYTRYVTREATYLGTEGMQPQENDLNIELGHRYHSSAVIPEPDENGCSHENPREAKGKPRSRAPHVWLSQDVSTLDLFGSKFVLLTGGGGVSWLTATSTLPIDAHRLEQTEFPEAYGITDTGAVLVRPDGFVAWRAKTAGSASAELLKGVLGRLLGR
jgi:hypothetical protein